MVATFLLSYVILSDATETRRASARQNKNITKLKIRLLDIRLREYLPMPIYEYQCGQCGHQLEAFQGLSEKPLTDCPQCHQAALEKLISTGGFQLKGTGWYKTDYSAKGKPKAEKCDVDTKAKATKESDSGAGS
jgi:putative FmdB family regulatory protein